MAETAGNRVQPSTHWTGRWCWTRTCLSRPWNYYAYFRRAFDLPAKPPGALVRVSADARYILFVNGRRIHQGPARSYAHHQSFDTLDIAPALQPGRNAICAIVHQFGVPTLQSTYHDASGFLLDGAIELDGQVVPLHTPTDWVCREAKAWRKDVARLTVQLGFQEHFDAGQEPAAWLSPDYTAPPEDGWVAPHDVGPVGVHPWVTMEPRGVPLLADHVELFKSICGQFTGENARGYKVADDVYHLPLQESRARDKSLVQEGAAILRDDADVATILPPPDGHFAMVVLDLGQIRAGHLILDIDDAAGDEIIDLLYTEDADRTGAPQILGRDCIGPSEEALADRYRCRAGQQRWEPFWYKGFRYATLIFRNIARPMKVRFVGLRQVHAALEPVGSFECSDERLTRIWRIGYETLRTCLFDAYVDCPSREQAQWWGDARIQFRANAYTFGDVSLFERGIRQSMQSQAADGSLHAAPPAEAPRYRLPDYMLAWVGTLWDHYFHTGRTDLLNECLPAMHRLFEFFDRHEAREGLIGGFDGFTIFLDWQELFKKDYSAVLNLMYLQALRWAAALCEVAGDEEAGNRYAKKSRSLSAAVERHFWDAKAKAWRDGFDAAANAPIDTVSQHANALAMLLHLKPETHPALARDILLKPAASRRSKILQASPFFYANVLDALVETNHRTQVVELIRDRWGALVDRGATTFWEVWDPENRSLCHAWSASPVYHLSQQVLGVMPVNIGWQQVRIAPLPMNLDFARGRVPSPLGVIKVEWEKAGEDQLAVRVDLPAGIEGEFIGPLGETRSLAPGSHEFHT